MLVVLLTLLLMMKVMMVTKMIDYDDHLHYDTDAADVTMLHHFIILS